MKLEMNQLRLQEQRQIGDIARSEAGLKGLLGAKELAHIQEDAIACQGERSVLETMVITAGRLETIEHKLTRLHGYLFGVEPMLCDSVVSSPDTNVRSLAGYAFGSTVEIERMLDEIYHRLAN